MTTMSEHQPVFPEVKTATHMPFFDGKSLVFCQSNAALPLVIQNAGTIWKRIHRNKILAERFKDLPRTQTVQYRAWKLAYCDWDSKVVRPLVTGMPEKMPERSPTFYREGGRIHLSFICGMPTSTGFDYHLYACSGTDWEHMEAPKRLPCRQLFFGFSSPHHLCWGARNAFRITEKATGRTNHFITGFYRISTMNFLADNPAKLLITGLTDKECRYQTVLFDLATGAVSDVSMGGPVYKASLSGTRLVFAERQADEFEKRQLFYGDCSLSPSTIQISKAK